MLSSNGKLILLHKGLNSIPKASKYDLLLSPEFYISKIEKLPVKYSFQAKKLAPSILEDSLPTNNIYEYFVKKDANSWQLFAYSPKEIEEFLKSCCKIDANKIGNIYFADQLKDILVKVPVGVDEKNALTLIDGKATIVPRSMLTSQNYAKFTSKLRPKKAFKFHLASKSSKDSKLDKNSIIVSVLLSLIAIAFIVEGISYKKALKQEEEKTANLLSNNPSLQGKMIRDSIKNKYEKIEKRERSIRELLNKYSQLSSKKSVLEKLNIEGNKLVAQFNVEPNEINHILSIAKTINLKATKLGSNKVQVEGVLKWVKVRY